MKVPHYFQYLRSIAAKILANPFSVLICALIFFTANYYVSFQAAFFISLLLFFALLRFDARWLIFLGFLFLGFSLFYLLLTKERVAEFLAIYAYYFLLGGVVLGGINLLLDGKIKNKSK